MAILAGIGRSIRLAFYRARTVRAADHLGENRRRALRYIGAILITAAAAWVLLRRGLYPGGSGDYYTHYFYYYIEVLKNHGLAPNDVWYHYYYSKGSGLIFLGMLLTDPEAPALTTFPCVIFAALAIATLAARMAPGSLWLGHRRLGSISCIDLAHAATTSAEGEFQKNHEEVSALEAHRVGRCARSAALRRCRFGSWPLPARLPRQS